MKAHSLTLIACLVSLGVNNLMFYSITIPKGALYKTPAPTILNLFAIVVWGGMGLWLSKGEKD